MFKILRNGVIGISIIIGLSGCQSELTNEEVKDLKACHIKETGISLWSKDILQVTKNLRNSGVGVTLLKDGSELVLDLGDNEKIVLQEIDYKNSSCYEVQLIQGKKGEFSKGNGDNFLLASAMFFGSLISNDKDKEIWKEKQALKQREKEGKLKVLNKKLEYAKMDYKRFEIFLESFHDLDRKYNFNNFDKLILSKDSLSDLKELLSNHTNYDKYEFKEYIIYLDSFLAMSDEERAKRNLYDIFSYKYSVVKNKLERSMKSNIKYEITKVNDEIDEVNTRY